MAEGEVEYESDPEEAKLSLKMRRREASDDEEEREGWGDRMEKPPRRIDDSEGESEGAAAEYQDEMEDEEEEEVEEEYYVDGDYVEEGGSHYGQSGGVEIWDGEQTAGGDVAGGKIVADQAKKGVSDYGDFENDGADGVPEEQKKEMEPFAVPTAGAFYMHDDRFRDNSRGRHRRMLGGRRLWESKDERKWGHDKFEQLTMQERHHGEHRRGSRGRYRGRGRNQGTDRVFTQVNRLKEIPNTGTPSNNNQGNAPKGARGRGPHKYQPFKNYDGPQTARKKLSEKLVDGSSRVSNVRTSENASNAEPEKIMPRKQVASGLNVASPPFYPTGSSTLDNNMANRRDGLSVSFDGSDQSISKDFAAGQSSGMVRGKSVVDSVNVGKLHIDESLYGISGRPQVPSSLATNSQPQLRSQGRGLSSPVQLAYQPVASGNQVNRVTSSSLLPSVQRNPRQFHSQVPLQASVQQFTQRFPSGGQASSPPKVAGPTNVLEREESVSTSETNLSKTEIVTKGKESMQGSAKGSFVYGGAQIIGAAGGIGRGHNDQNFPAFLPVMQFGGQHPGGIGVPAVGMAFPGYVAQPQLGIGSSEMTWLPVFAGAAGALGAAYCPPYISVDGSYNARASGPTSSVSHSSSKESNGEKDGDELKPAQNAELLTEEVGQRQKNPRRYTEMKFDQ